jgi:hypothetical protein
MGGAGRRGDIASQSNTDSKGPKPTDSDSGSEGDDLKVDQPPRLPRHQRPIADIELWFDYWSEELVTSYHILIDQCQQQGYAFLENCDITKFAEFVYENSSKVPPPP